MPCYTKHKGTAHQEPKSQKEAAPPPVSADIPNPNARGLKVSNPEDDENFNPLRNIDKTSEYAVLVSAHPSLPRLLKSIHDQIENMTPDQWVAHKMSEEPDRCSQLYRERIDANQTSIHARCKKGVQCKGCVGCNEQKSKLWVKKKRFHEDDFTKERGEELIKREVQAGLRAHRLQGDNAGLRAFADLVKGFRDKQQGKI